MTEEREWVESEAEWSRDEYSSADEESEEEGDWRKKPGPASFRDKAVLPRGCGRETRIQARNNRKRENSTLNVIRAGFKNMWKGAPRLCRQYMFGEVGSFNKKNHHGGLMWGYPNECRMGPTGEERHGRVLRVQKVHEAHPSDYPEESCICQRAHRRETPHKLRVGVHRLEVVHF